MKITILRTPDMGGITLSVGTVVDMEPTLAGRLLASGEAVRAPSSATATVSIPSSSASPGTGGATKVRAASTANINLAAPGSAVDGVTLVSGTDTFLAKNQTASAENGLYLFNGAASAATRLSGFTAFDALAGATVAVTEGTVNRDTLWLCTSDAGGVIGTTAIAFTGTFPPPAGSLTNTMLANMPASTMKANLGGSPAAPSDASLAAIAAALGITSGGLGQIRAAGMGSSTAVPAATAAVTEMTRITIPGGSLGTKGVARILYRLRRDGSTDAGTFSVHIGSISGTTNQILSFTSFTGSNVAEEGELLLLGNGVDQSSVMRQNTGSINALAASSSGNATNFTVDTSSDWVVIFAGTTGATNNLVVESATATISNPAASNYVATYANIGGVPTDDPDLVAYVAGVVDPGVSTEAAGRVLTQADNGKTLEYTGASAGNFTVPNTLTAPFSCELVQWSTGVPTFISDGTSVIRVPNGKSASVASQYDGVAIQLRSTGPVTVRVI